MTDLNHSPEDVRDMLLETKEFGFGRQEVFDLCEDYLTLLAENKELRPPRPAKEFSSPRH